MIRICGDERVWNKGVDIDKIEAERVSMGLSTNRGLRLEETGEREVIRPKIGRNKERERFTGFGVEIMERESNEEGVEGEEVGLRDERENEAGCTLHRERAVWMQGKGEGRWRGV
ncbi:hypothetical protein AMTR_s00023p00204740 [Amborella trichopoda]|uniref:Uncharacterized protein n=1 Tax=Amborella trichopoda TaxID=13333 RepID=W1NKE4_AMBTC|nr:hypothetical protein AMTR_s00023p00204740 [Amborella trichopoda]